ncbi:MAG: LamG domain-containing protein, partial [Victivallales bacterium]
MIISSIGNNLTADYVRRGDMTGFYSLTAGSGKTAIDKSRHKKDGGIFFAQWVTEDKTALLEFREPFSWVELPKHSLNYRKSFTIQLWILPDNYLGSRFLVSNGTFWLPQGYMFYLNEKKLCFKMNTRSGVYKIHASLSCGSRHWLNVAVSYDAEGKKLSLFANGQLLKQAPASGELKPYNAYSKKPCIGAIACGNNTVRNEYNWQFRGFIRDVLFYGVSLSPAEIAANYKNSKADCEAVAICGREQREAKLFTSRIRVRVKDEHDREIAARIYLRNTATGRYYGPARLFYNQSGDMRKPAYFYVSVGSACSLRVPAGKYELTALHGFEYFPGETVFSLAPGEDKLINVKLARFIDMRAGGWFSGDHHFHCGTHGNKSRDTFPSWDDVCAIAQAEDLAFADVREKRNSACKPVATKDFLAKRGGIERRHYCYILPAETRDSSGTVSPACLKARKNDGIACSHYHYGEMFLELPLSGGRYIFDWHSHCGHRGE